MSDFWIILIPEKAGYVPPDGKQNGALDAFRGLTGEAQKVAIKLSDRIRFVDCGENFLHVSCPACGTELKMEWWQEKMENDWDNGFRLAPITLPCCSAIRNLHELRYDWQQGFARFSLEAVNPNFGGIFPNYNLNALETILDCSLRVVYRHIWAAHKL